MSASCTSWGWLRVMASFTRVMNSCEALEQVSILFMAEVARQIHTLFRLRGREIRVSLSPVYDSSCVARHLQHL